MKDVIKTIQSRAKRAGLELTREEIRTRLITKYQDVDLNEVDVDEAYNHVCSSLAPRENINQSSVAKIQEDAQLELINSVAAELKIDLPIQAITQIVDSIDWAISSRVEIMQQLRAAVNSWADYKLQQLEESSAEIEQETMQLFQEVNNKLLNVISADNERLKTNSLKLSDDINQSVKSFRESAAAAFKVFKIPAKP